MTTGTRRRAAPAATSRHWALVLTLSAASLMASEAYSASLSATISDGNGLRLEHAIVSLEGSTPQRAAAGTRTNVDQRSRQFAPTVLPIQTGTEVAFPNTDDVRHHVYSFSHPNAFELKLYHGEPSKPILFDDPGIVVLGCNIHDGMVGYLMVVDTPWFGKTGDDGITRIEELEPGRYTLQIWHPDLGMRVIRKTLTIGRGDASISVSLDTPGSTQKSNGKSSLQALFDD